MLSFDLLRYTRYHANLEMALFVCFFRTRLSFFNFRFVHFRFQETMGVTHRRKLINTLLFAVLRQGGLWRSKVGVKHFIGLGKHKKSRVCDYLGKSLCCLLVKSLQEYVHPTPARGTLARGTPARHIFAEKVVGN